MLITYRFSYSKILKFSFFIRGANIDKIFTQVKNSGNFFMMRTEKSYHVT